MYQRILQISDGSGSNAGEEVSIGKAITTDYLNLRSGAGLNHNVLTVLAKGAVVDVIDNSDGTWVKVKNKRRHCGLLQQRLSSNGGYSTISQRN